MDKIKSDLLQVVNKNSLLNYISELKFSDKDSHAELYKWLIVLHNNGTLDVISAFNELKNDKSHEFFLIRNIFEKILPEIKSPMLDVMECVLHLVKEAGHDMAFGAIFTPYIDFCLADSSRIKQALVLIEKSTHKFSDLLTPTIVAGSRIDTELYIKKAIQLVNHENIEIKKRAIFSLGRIVYLENRLLLDLALSTLETSVEQESDEALITSLIQSAFSLYKQNKLLEERVSILIDIALLKCGEQAIHTASHIFGYDFKELSEPLLDMFLLNLQRTNPVNKATLDNIDYGLEKLLETETPEKGIEFIETILTTNTAALSIEVFDGVSRGLLKNDNGILNRLMTRWFIRGEKALCTAIHDIVSQAQKQNIVLSVEPNELTSKNITNIAFIARKAVGYLFMRPVSATSIIISLISYANDDEVAKVLTDLLFDPLLLNFSGAVKPYLLKNQTENENNLVKTACKESIDSFEKYLNNLKSTGNIPELYPSQSQREAYNRYFSRQMSVSMKEAESKSVFSSLVSKSVILYGGKSINYYYNGNEKPQRTELTLQNHSTSMEFPRSQIINPFGLDYMLRVYRAEQIKT
ncbi:MAG: hypothetical protein QM504_05300 [Pseudomonadota bacterium]